MTRRNTKRGKALAPLLGVLLLGTAPLALAGCGGNGGSDAEEALEEIEDEASDMKEEVEDELDDRT